MQLTSKIRNSLKALILFLFSFAAFTSNASSFHHKEIDRLLEIKNYLNAAEYIADNPDLMNDDEYFRRYVNVLVNYYAITIQFNMFGLRDLEAQEEIDQIRGNPGQYSMIGVNLEEQLFERYKQNPESAYLNLAIGEYLSRGEVCGCSQPSLFVGEFGGDYQYFDRAYIQGLSDEWSVFRIGLHHHSKGELNKAIQFYHDALPDSANNPSVTYNLAVALYQNHQDKDAKTYALQALGIYEDKDLDSDTYHFYGMLLFNEGSYAEAEKHLIKALKLKQWHPQAFETLLSLYRKRNFHNKYRELILDYISLDYGNTFMFNQYVVYLENFEIIEEDRAVISELEKRDYSSDKETGAVYFNIGRVYDLDRDKVAARNSYKKSLTAMKQQKDPPKGAIPALLELIKKLDDLTASETDVQS